MVGHLDLCLISTVHRGFAKAHNMIASSLGSHDQIGNRHPHVRFDD